MSNQVGQPLLPVENLEEALAHLARVEGVGGTKGLATSLRPDLFDDPEEAGKWLRRALNPKRREAFQKKHLDRAFELGQRVGCHILWDWYCRDRGYETSEPINAKSRRLLLMEEDERLASRRREIQQQIEKLDAAVVLKAAK